jgi:hypothetical protein
MATMEDSLWIWGSVLPRDEVREREYWYDVGTMTA